MTSLRAILRLNSASCIAFGALFTFNPAEVSVFLGDMPLTFITIIGAVLLANGAHLILASYRPDHRPTEILWFSSGDLLWWLGSIALVASGLWITTPAGVATTMVVAVVVAGFGVAQLTALGVSRSGLRSREHWRRIGRSWLALPAWVKAWLFVLNAVFLAAPVCLPWAEASVILLAYVASGPLILGIAVFEGGLSRVAGIGHLVPWTPLLILSFWWSAKMPTGSVAAAYSLALSLALAICLAFDGYDLWRWWRGERAVFAVESSERAIDEPTSRSV